MKRILIVEDDRRLASLLSDALLEAGFEGAYAFDLAEADAIFSSSKIDAAILDICLADAPSFELARRLDTCGVPFLFASSMRRIDMPHDMRWQPLIGKPYSAEQLIIALRALCGEIHRPDAAHWAPSRPGKHPVI
ncbi:response regulator transcription factor [Lysobacter tyrosinilyticus]